MFKGATSFNKDISKWDTAAVSDMISTFNGATSFNQDLSSWNVAKVTSTCANFDANAGAAWVQPKPKLPATCLGFTIAANSVTILCPGAAVGEKGVVGGVVYTKRDRAGLLALLGAANEAELATSCTSGVTDMSAMFNGASTFNVNIASWDTSSVLTMKDMFKGALAFDQDISKWTTAAVTDMQSMFKGATSFNNDVGGWNTAAVSDMISTFNGATSFNQDLSSWSMATVLASGNTCTNFNVNTGLTWALPKPSLPSACIAFAPATNAATILCPNAAVGDSGVANGVVYTKRDRAGLLALVGAANEAELATSCTSGVTDLSGMFNGASTFNVNIASWDTRSVLTMKDMFKGALAFDQDISKWTTAAVTDMQSMFNGATSFNKDISGWSTVEVTDMISTFNGATSFNQDLSSWNVAKVTSTCANFDANAGAAWVQPKPSLPRSCLRFSLSANLVTILCPNAAVGEKGVVNGAVYTKRDRAGLLALVGAANEAELATSCTSGVTDLSGMFNGASTFNVNIASWDTSSVSTMKDMFKGALAFDQDIGKWTTAAVTDMQSMFNGATSFNKDISGWSTVEVTDMISTFNGATSFNQDLSSWNVAKVTSTCANFDANAGAAWVQPKPSLPRSCLRFSLSANLVTILCPNAAVGEKGVVNGAVYTNRDRAGLLALVGAANEAELATSCTSGVTDMSAMFNGASTFNVNIASWDTSSVLTMKDMFKGALAFDQDISKWTTAAVTDMISTFNGATSFNKDLSSWNVANVGSTCANFERNTGVTWVQPKPNLPATCLGFTIAANSVTILCPGANVGDTGVVGGVVYTKRDQAGLLALVGAANEAELATSCTSGVTDLSGMFNGASTFNVNIASWDTSSVLTMKDMFNGATSFNQDISKWTTAAVTDMISTFNGATSFNKDLSSWNVANVGSTCANFERNTGVTWVQPKPNLPATCLGFTIAANSVTILCPGANVGDTGVVGGVVYTKRDRAGLLALVGAANEAELATSCTSGVTDMHAMFNGASTFNVNIASWDTSSVSTMSSMFNGATSFNQDISKWTTAAVTDMTYMFNGATSFNKDISGWNTAKVLGMTGMFQAATAFNNGEAAMTWGANTAEVTSMTDMFRGATRFNKDISGWNTAKVRTMLGMFRDATAFNNGGADLTWGAKTAAVTNMEAMFKGATSFNNDISGWNTAAVTDMVSMFNGATAFNQDLSLWNVARVTTICTDFDALAGPAWLRGKPALHASCLRFTFAANGVTVICPNANVGEAGGLNGVAYKKQDRTGLLALKGSANEADLATSCTSGERDMSSLFSGASTFNVNIASWDTSSVTYMGGMFNYARAFNQDISKWDTSSVTSMGWMFLDAVLFNQDISGWNTAKVWDMTACSNRRLPLRAPSITVVKP